MNSISAPSNHSFPEGNVELFSKYIPVLNDDIEFQKNIKRNLSEQCEGIVKVFNQIGHKYFKIEDLRSAVKTLEINQNFLQRQVGLETEGTKMSALMPIFTNVVEKFKTALENIENAKYADLDISWNETMTIPYFYFFQQKICTGRYSNIKFAGVSHPDQGFYVTSYHAGTIDQSVEHLIWKNKKLGTKFTLVH